MKSYNEFINENIQEQSKYEDWEKGVIMAWGGVLYLGYHDVPNQIDKIVDLQQTKKSFLEYFRESENDEDIQDWMSDGPPTMNGGYALFDKNRLSNILSNMANKTKIIQPLKVYRTSDSELAGWSSYTLNKDIDYNWSNNDNIKYEYELPIGFPVIYADGIADKDEVILNLSQEDINNFSTSNK